MAPAVAVGSVSGPAALVELEIVALAMVWDTDKSVATFSWAPVCTLDSLLKSAAVSNPALAPAAGNVTPVPLDMVSPTLVASMAPVPRLLLPPVPRPSSAALSAALRSPARAPVASGTCTLVPVLLVTSSDVAVRVPRPRSVASLGSAFSSMASSFR